MSLCCWFDGLIPVAVAGLLFVLAYRTSVLFRYVCKMILFYTAFMIASVVCVLFTFWRGPDPENFKVINPIYRYVSRLFGIRWLVRGFEKFEELRGKPCVIVCNHQSSVDVLGMMFVWPDRTVPLAKRSLQYLGPLGLMIKLGGAVFIDRVNKENAHAAMHQATEDMKEKNLKVWIFPEGTRNHEGAMLPFKKGAFHMAVQAKVPIVPVVFSDYAPFYSKTERRFLPSGFVIISVLDPIETKGRDVTELTELTRERMLAEFERISPEANEVNRRDQVDVKTD